VVAAVLTIGGWAAWQLTHQPEEMTCAGVGLINTPVAPSEEAALRLFVAREGGDPTTWRRSGANVWEPRQGERAVPDYSSISVGEVEGGWAASGACV